VSCSHLRDTCTEERSQAFGFVPSPGVCSVCPHYDGPVRGLGDVIHRVAEVTGVSKVIPKSCGCQKRREVLNEIVPNPLK
jgi:hypothetical protein